MTTDETNDDATNDEIERDNNGDLQRDRKHEDNINETATDSSSKAILEQFANGLKGFELANRLNVKENSVSTVKTKGDEYLKQWSAKRDPDHIAWQFVKFDKRGKYYPIGY